MPIIEASNVASKNNNDNTNKQVGHYLIQRSLGEGEFGHVYLARDVRHKGPLVAIKLFKAFLSQLEKESFFEYTVQRNNAKNRKSDGGIQR